MCRRHDSDHSSRVFSFAQAAGSERRVHNFGNDLKDSECYTILLNQIAPNVCDKQALSTQDKRERAGHVIRNAQALQVETFIQPGNIVEGNKRLNMAFCAQIFNTCPGLTVRFSRRRFILAKYIYSIFLQPSPSPFALLCAVCVFPL